MVGGPVGRVVVRISVVAALVDVGHPEVVFRKRQNASEIVHVGETLVWATPGAGARDVVRFGVLGNHEQRHPEPVDVAAAPAILLNGGGTRCRRTLVDGRRGNVVVEATPRRWQLARALCRNGRDGPNSRSCQGCSGS